MSIRCLWVVLVLLIGAGCANAQVQIGEIDQQQPPRAEGLRLPDGDDPVETIGMHAVVEGSVDDKIKANLYVLGNPLSNLDTRDIWWVQQPVLRRGTAIRAACQFGEGAQGRGEYFALVAIATERDWDVGQQIRGIPKSVLYSKLKIVKRVR
jgi:hypothetical protein